MTDDDFAHPGPMTAGAVLRARAGRAARAMRVVRAWLPAAALGLVVASCGGGGDGGPAESVSGAPFRATVDLVEEISINGAPPCFATGRLRGDGEASYLGRASFTATDCVNFPDPANPLVLSFRSGGDREAATLLSAGGEQMYIRFEGRFLPQAQGPHRIEGSFQIVGGTGRFAAASGRGTLSGEEIIEGSSGRGRVQLDGTISF